MLLQASVSCLSVSKLELQNRKDMFDFGTNRRFLMLAPLDLCLRTGRVIFTLTGTTIDFVPDFLSGRIFLSGFGTLFCSKISAVTVDLFFLTGEKVGSNTDIMHIGSSYLYCVDKSAFRIHTDVCFIPKIPDISLLRRMCFRITLFLLILR